MTQVEDQVAHSRTVEYIRAVMMMGYDGWLVSRHKILGGKRGEGFTSTNPIVGFKVKRLSRTRTVNF